MVFAYWCCDYFRNYTWKLNIIKAVVMVIKKERKYSLINPFWLVTMIEELC